MLLVPSLAVSAVDSSPAEPPVVSSASAGQFSSRVDMVQVTVAVLHGRHFVHGLPREAFRVFEDDVRRPLTFFAAGQTPLELVVAVDVSSSMRKVIGQVKENTSRFLAALPPGPQLTLLAFNDEPHVLADPSMPLEAQLGAIEPLAPYGMTSLYDVMLDCFDSLGQQVGRRAIVMFSDGEDTASRASCDTVARRAETSDAVLYILGHGEALKSADLKELCERLAEKSGGRAFFPRQAADLREAFDSILDEISSQYLLAYPPTAKAPDGKWHRIRVEVADGRYAVRARRGYRYDAAPSPPGRFPPAAAPPRPRQ
jgi:Ca-activated chloride channel family protein